MLAHKILKKCWRSRKSPVARGKRRKKPYNHLSSKVFSSFSDAFRHFSCFSLPSAWFFKNFLLFFKRSAFFQDTFEPTLLPWGNYITSLFISQQGSVCRFCLQCPISKCRFESEIRKKGATLEKG